MKQLATQLPVVEVENEGLFSLLNKRVQIDTLVYIYTGTLVGVNDKYIKLEDASLVFETGPLSDKKYKLTEKIPYPKYIMLSTMTGFEQANKTI